MRPLDLDRITALIATATRLTSREAGPNSLPTPITSRGRSRASASIAEGSARGSPPCTLTTVAPAAAAVVSTAVIAGSSRATPTSTAT